MEVVCFIWLAATLINYSLPPYHQRGPEGEREEDEEGEEEGKEPGDKVEIILKAAATGRRRKL